MTTVRNAEDRSRYELVEDGAIVAIADYRVLGDVVTLPHTEVRSDLRGRGLGAQLVEGALEDVRARGRRVEPACWYVREFIDANPAYRDLVA